MERIMNALKLMRNDISKETEIFLDNMDLGYEPPKFQISFNGATIELPINDSELNYEIDGFLKGVYDIAKEYSGITKRAFIKVLSFNDDPESTFVDYLTSYNESPEEIEIEDIESTVNCHLGEDEICGIWIEDSDNCTEYWVVCGETIIHQEM